MRKTIVVSGGSEGLGKEIARVLSKKQSVTILSSHEQKLKKAARELGCHYIVCDVTKYANCRDTINQIVAIHGQIDCLVNNAGVWIEGNLEDCDPESIDHSLKVNTLGTIYLTKAAIPSMKKHKQGKIINIIAEARLPAKTKQSVYISSKWAVAGFTQSLQLEVSQYGISVTGIYPGKMKTRMYGKTGIEKDMADALDPAEVATIISSIVELPSHVVVPELGIKHIDN